MPRKPRKLKSGKWAWGCERCGVMGVGSSEADAITRRNKHMKEAHNA